MYDSLISSAEAQYKEYLDASEHAKKLDELLAALAPEEENANIDADEPDTASASASAPAPAAETPPPPEAELTEAVHADPFVAVGVPSPRDVARNIRNASIL